MGLFGDRGEPIFLGDRDLRAPPLPTRVEEEEEEERTSMGGGRFSSSERAGTDSAAVAAVGAVAAVAEEAIDVMLVAGEERLDDIGVVAAVVAVAFELAKGEEDEVVEPLTLRVCCWKPLPLASGVCFGVVVETRAGGAARAPTVPRVPEADSDDR